MNLPQRKKTAEEIAKLRDELGVFAQPPAPQAIAPGATADLPISPPAQAAAGTTTCSSVTDPGFSGFRETTVPAPECTAPSPVTASVFDAVPSKPLSPLPVPTAPRGPKPVSSLKKSEQIPALPAASTPVFQAVPDVPVVKSLRKSEQAPLPSLRPASPYSHLPAARHTNQDLNELRRRDAISARMTPPPPKLAAPMPFVAAAYLAAIGGALMTWFGAPLYATATAVTLALLAALFIFLKKPQSRHHAAFLLIIALCVTIFGAFHYFPHLRHVT